MLKGFRTIEPKILYFGTPVALISSQNEDGRTNLTPISSFWALGWTFMLGFLDETKTAENLARAGMRHQYSVTRDVAKRGKACAAHRKEPCA